VEARVVQQVDQEQVEDLVLQDLLAILLLQLLLKEIMVETEDLNHIQLAVPVAVAEVQVL
tara:strand:- start:361 stop:540 length:180 start_codon:yes stop_codon:yes gene_type:complete